MGNNTDGANSSKEKGRRSQEGGGVDSPRVTEFIKVW